MSVPREAWWGRCLWALVGMLGLVGGCAGPGGLEVVPDDVRLDELWCALVQGDLDRAQGLVDEIEEPSFRMRSAADLAVARRGRPAVLVEQLDEGSPMAPRYLASNERARQRLRAFRARGGLSPALTLEDARRSGSVERRESMARASLTLSPGGPEALAMLTESLLGRRKYSEVGELLETAPETTRLTHLRRRWEASTGRLRLAAEGLLSDLREERAIPSGVELLGRLLRTLPDAELERRVLEVLESREPTGVLQQRKERSLRAELLARQGRLEDSLRLLPPAERGDFADTSGDIRLRRASRLALERGVATPTGAMRTLEGLVDAAPERVAAPEAMGQLRLAHEWDLTARASYTEAARGGDTLDLEAFLAELDERAEPLGADLVLAEIPRIDYGLFGEMLDSAVLREALPGSFVVGGKAFGMPPELTWYDLQSERVVALPDPPGGSYDECHVRRLRVPGFAASFGARFAGAGLDRFVFLDLDQVSSEASSTVSLPVSGPPLAPRSAHGADERQSLDEPLETAARLGQAARDAAGDRYGERVLEALGIHERRHIIDVRLFLKRGFFGQLSDVISAGLLPGAVRAEVERRAQLDALRQATDPRIPLAHAVSYLPVQGSATRSEHALGYEDLVADFVAVLDRGDWEGAQSLEELGLDPDAVLLQQLHRLPPETIRSIAEAIEF